MPNRRSPMIAPFTTPAVGPKLPMQQEGSAAGGATYTQQPNPQPQQPQDGTQPVTPPMTAPVPQLSPSPPQDTAGAFSMADIMEMLRRSRNTPTGY